MVAMRVLEARAERRESSSLSSRTNMRVWRNGILRRLKISRRKACGFKSRLSHQQAPVDKLW
jgi:hypothetical protein